MNTSRQKGVITIALVAALSAVAAYLFVPRKFDAGEFNYYVDLQVQASHLDSHCPYSTSVVAGLRTTTEHLQTWVKYRGDAGAIKEAANSAKILDDAISIGGLLPASNEDCVRAAHNLQLNYERVLTTLGKEK